MNARSPLGNALVQILSIASLVLLSLVSLGAQSIFSVNAIGYVDVNLVAGSNLVANPFNAATNNIANLFRGLPDGSFFLPWDQRSGTFGPTNRYSAASGWTDPNAILIAPDGGFLWLPAPRQISFVGEPWLFASGPLCVTYPQGDFISGWFAQTICGICEFPPCQIYPEGTSLFKWDPINQNYNTYTFFFGTWDPVDPIIGPAESFRMIAPQTFSVRSPFQSTVGGGTIHHGRSFSHLGELQRNGSNLTFRWAATNGTGYSLLCTTNLQSGVWQIAQQGTVSDGSGFAQITVAMTNKLTLYKVHPSYGGPNPFLLSRLSGRGTSSFSFDFFAPSNAAYRIERTINFAAPAWQSITNIAAEANTLVTFTDRNATAASGYYRVAY